MQGHYVEKDIKEIFLSEEEIQKRVAQLGEQISKDYEGKELIAVGILRGSVVFFADLMRAVRVPMVIDFMAASSYGKGSETTGSVHIKFDMQEDIKGKHLLIVEDIIDSGVTLSCLKEMLQARKPASIEMCCLLNKPSRRVADVDVAYVGFDIPDEFVVGYGMDYASKYRNYKNIGILKREIYE
ncbi:MAG: hypoxanthine phosphoribosyltransferase [Christensenellaceae bacterium]